AERDELLIALGTAPDVRDRGIELFKASVDDREQFPTVRGQIDLAGRAIEETEADAAFQFPDQDAEARWRDEERLGRAGEVAMLRDQPERAQLPGADFHC